MTHADFIHGFPTGLCRLAVNTDLTENDLRMFQSYGIVVDHKYAHVMRDKAGFIDLPRPVRFAQSEGYGECGAFSFFADNIDVAIHELYDAFRDRHTQAG